MQGESAETNQLRFGALLATHQRTAKVRRSSAERGDHAVCASQLKGDCQENDKSKGPQCHKASCDQSGTIASDQFGHFIPPSFSGKTKGKSAGFRFGRFFHTNKRPGASCRQGKRGLHRQSESPSTSPLLSLRVIYSALTRGSQSAARSIIPISGYPSGQGIRRLEP